MARKLKLRWEEPEISNDIFSLCKGVFQKDLYKGYWRCWADLKGQSWTYLVCPSGATYYHKGFMPFSLFMKSVDKMLSPRIIRWKRFYGDE